MTAKVTVSLYEASEPLRGFFVSIGTVSRGLLAVACEGLS